MRAQANYHCVQLVFEMHYTMSEKYAGREAESQQKVSHVSPQSLRIPESSGSMIG
jgi:hypothetical protein